MAAFETLYYRHRDWVIQVAFRFTGDRHAALDVAQEVFVYLCGKIPRIELRSKLRTWLYPVIRNLARTWSRKSRRLVLSQGEPSEAVTEVIAPAAGEADAEHVRLVLAGLPEAHREVLTLRFVDELSLQQISQATGAALGTVKSRLHHALESLRRKPEIRKILQE